jgi:hypothetical protein
LKVRLPSDADFALKASFLLPFFKASIVNFFDGLKVSSGILYTFLNLFIFICSAKLQHDEYISGGTSFHMWFNGELKTDRDKLKKDLQGKDRMIRAIKKD